MQITVSKESTVVERNIQLFVDQYNKVVDKIKKETAFDPNGSTTGLLFGNSEVIRVQQSLSNFINHRSFGTGKIQSLNDLGLSLSGEGKLEFDKSRLGKQIEKNFDDVKSFLTDSTKGFGVRAKSMLDSLVGVEKGLLVTRSSSLQRQIELSTARVTTMSARLDTERTRLLNQFYAMEESISKIKNSANGLSSLFAASQTTSSTTTR